ncbi:hypothetical protein [Azoarcus olearius]|uniref:hypothetical protein n=1 Tax=Azoarcus sp. (strain BH72) TaxID=418699 RepID=UPI000806DB7F
MSRGGEARGAALAAPAGAWSSARLARLLSVALFGALVAYVLASFRQHGISNDEEVQHVYGRLLVDFYGSGFADRSAFAYKNLYLYGGLFDLIAAGLERVVPMNVWDLRHLLSAAFGILGMAGTWLLTRRVAALAFGPEDARAEWAGFLALLLLGLTGAWSGALFTHTKDVPFATAMVWSLYFTVVVLQQLPRPGLATLVGLGVAFGCAFGLRVGAVFAVFYLGTGMLLAAWLAAPDVRGRSVFLLRSLRRLLPAVVLAVALMGLFWPWSVMAPGNLYTAMTTFSHFSFQLDTILAGVVMQNGDAPATYLSRYLLVRLPELFLLGLALALLAGLRTVPRLSESGSYRRAAVPWLPVVLAALFPLGYTLLAAPPLYNGIRHFTFLLPPFAVVAAIGLVSAWVRAARWPRARLAGAVACAVMAAAHLTTLVRLHPYEYVAYNGLAGGLRGTVERWEQDYWALSLRELTTDLEALVSAEGRAPAHPYRVAVCAESLQAAAWLDERFEVTRDWRVADFFLSPTHMDCDTASKGPVVAEVVREGVVLGVLRDRRMLVGEERAPR